ncbi:hypothetical protein [Myxococcus phage Mx1]|nr:hypothetical protein [Myxococcus phage Mx1]
MSLKEIVKKLKEAQKCIDEDLSGWDPRTITGKRNQQQQARDEIDSLKKKYTDELPGHVFLVFVKGTQPASFLGLARQEGALVGDASEIYRTFAEGVRETQDKSQPSFSAFQSIRLVREMSSYAYDNMIRSMPLPSVSIGDLDTLTPSLEDVVAVVRRSIRATSADDLNAFHLKKVLTEQGIQDGNDKKTIPVIIVNASDEEIQGLKEGLFPGAQSLVVDSKKQSSEELVETIQKKILAVLKKKQ